MLRKNVGKSSPWLILLSVAFILALNVMVPASELFHVKGGTSNVQPRTKAQPATVARALPFGQAMQNFKPWDAWDWSPSKNSGVQESQSSWRPTGKNTGLQEKQSEWRPAGFKADAVQTQVQNQWSITAPPKPPSEQETQSAWSFEMPKVDMPKLQFGDEGGKMQSQSQWSFPEVPKSPFQGTDEPVKTTWSLPEMPKLPSFSGSGENIDNSGNMWSFPTIMPNFKKAPIPDVKHEALESAEKMLIGGVVAIVGAALGVFNSIDDKSRNGG